MSTIIEHPHITKKNTTDEPVIKGTNVSVRAIAELWLAGAQPDEIKLHIPQISLAQIFDALSYYHDQKNDIDSYIEKNKIPENMRGTSLSR